MRILAITLLGLSSLLLMACDPAEKTLLQQIKNSGELRVVTRNSPTTYYEAADGFSGFEHDLVQEFASKLGVQPVFILKDNEEEILSALESGAAHMAAAGLSRSKELEKRVEFSSSYQKVNQLLVYRIGTTPPKTMKGIAGRHIEVPAHSRYARTLTALKTRYPELEWTESPDRDTEELLNVVSDGLLEFTVTDSHIYKLNRRHFPALRSAFAIQKSERLAWAFPLYTDGSLKLAARDFIKSIKRNGRLKELLDRHFGAALKSDAVNLSVFHLRIQNRLPKYQSLFQKSAERYNMDWRLLAAISYQESFWNPRSVSPTGVRGIMMLTRTTAREMDVANRLDPEQAIEGGARYINKLMDQIPLEIKEPDRIWFALAAYNVGMGHLKDAQIITQQQKGNPGKWNDVQQRLPLLSRRVYYKKTKHGYARGREPVRYVTRIRNYYEALKKVDEEEREEEQNKAINLRAPAI
ncbi:MAG: membrane-bound lytic murein transglycosylase MltF [Proteobacteria bacterium]|nr:membrane-bound lytic murein transglycosylase MltF [Pseudomonadota bacterium]